MAVAASEPADVAAVIAAAGRGQRLGALENKAFVELAGKPLVWYALRLFRKCPEIGEIILVVAPEDVERARRLLRAKGDRSERVVAGGAQRQASVRAALEQVRASADLVVIHDAARPFAQPALVHTCLEQARLHGAAAAAVQATDTVKEADQEGVVRATLDRSRIWLVQTPQAFRRNLLEEAHRSAEQAGVTATDDAFLVERLGHAVWLVEGDSDNIKITHPDDVSRSEQVLQPRRGRLSAGGTMRCGIGFDAHRFAEDRPLVLAGVRLRDSRGLLGHSDGDAVCHAICDALLGAVGAGDIGTHFPDSDAAYRWINSLSLLQRVGETVRKAGWEIENIDVVVITEEPRLAPHVEKMRQALAEAARTEAGRISVKGKTTEGMGFTGRAEGIAAQAIATLRPSRTPRARGKAEDR